MYELYKVINDICHSITKNLHSPECLRTFFYSQDKMFHGQEPAPELQPDRSSERSPYPLIFCILVLQGFKTHFHNRINPQEFLVSTLREAASVAAHGHKGFDICDAKIEKGSTRYFTLERQRLILKRSYRNQRVKRNSKQV